jgi:hypothetical protein
MLFTACIDFVMRSHQDRRILVATIVRLLFSLAVIYVGNVSDLRGSDAKPAETRHEPKSQPHKSLMTWYYYNTGLFKLVMTGLVALSALAVVT